MAREVIFFKACACGQQRKFTITPINSHDNGHKQQVINWR